MHATSSSTKPSPQACLAAGKTTALGMLSGLTRPTGGECHVMGHSMISAPAQARQHLGFCPQQNVFFSRLTVQEHLLLYAAIKGIPGGFRGQGASAAASHMLQVCWVSVKRSASFGRLKHCFRLPLWTSWLSPCAPHHARYLRTCNCPMHLELSNLT